MQDGRLDAMRFALLRRPGRATRGSRILAALLRHPRPALGILTARLTGKRLRARQALLALVGLDHDGLWWRGDSRPTLLPLAGRGRRWGGGRLPARHPAAPPSPSIALRKGEGSAAHTDTPEELAGIGSAADAPFLVLTAPGHALLPDALDRLSTAFADDPALQAVYGDALFLSDAGATMPVLRPAFDPDYLMAVDYVGPVVALRRSAVGAVGDTMAALDLLLRVSARFGPSSIRHLSRFLSTWEPRTAGEGGSADGATRLAVVRRHLDRTGESGTRASLDTDGVVTVERPLPDLAPLVSLIVPTRDRLDLLRPCLASLRARTDWPACEILVCDNDSREPETLAYFRELERDGAARVVACPGPFDFAAMNNAAASQATGRLLAFVNNDVVAFRPDWLGRMVREALRPEVGAVGAKLLDGEGRVQHAGVVLGTGGLVTHGHRFFPGDAPGYLSALRATRRVSAVTAACLVVEASKFAAVGGFDAASFAVDFNDVDLCLRLNAAGYRTLLVASAVLHHHEAASRRWTEEARARHAREVEALRRRWGPLLAQDPHYHPGFDPDLGTYAERRADWPATLR